ncbi:hypothetical protein BEL04_03455 [Mucilaginibacter sp. PPCGB 2223]|nr:hypothetical protein BEL04_03455 [Mucilaginibacter sp. PPCGB 2223]
MKQYTIVFILISLSLAGCRSSDSSFKQVQDGDLTIQVTHLKAVSKDDNLLSFKLRLIPDKQLIEEKSSNQKTALYYKMDSCFYIAEGLKKNYAVMVQPVANGVSGTYEYLLEFENGNAPQADTINLIYNDKYINQKSYSLKITDK